MDFSTSEDYQSLQQLARQICTDFCDGDGFKTAEMEPDHFHQTLWQALAEAGLLGVALPQSCGGSDLGFGALALLWEEAGRAAAPLPLAATLLAPLLLQRIASDAVVESWLAGLASGGLLLSLGCAEAGGQRLDRPACTADNSVGNWTLQGQKDWICSAQRSDGVLVSAATGDGPAIFLLTPEHLNGRLTPQRVTSGEYRYQLQLDGLTLPATACVATGAAAAEGLAWLQQASRIAACCTAIGLCDSMMRRTASYTSEREQFGRAVASFQAVGHRMADCYIDVECLSLVTRQAVSQFSAEADADEAITIAKIWCGDVTHRVSQAAQHCHGGAGIDRDYPLYRYCLQARQLELADGVSAQLLAELGHGIAAAA